MNGSMNSLSSELLIEIFSLVKSSFWGTADLLPCLEVCRRWYELAITVLYRHIVLGTGNIRRFAASFNLQYAGHVRSLTLRLIQPPLSTYDLGSIIAANAELARRLRLLEPLLGSLDKLLSFSLYVPAIVPEKCRFKVSARSIIGLLDSIPQSCANIEIDSGGYDRNIIAGGEEAHICESLRLLLPRMNHVRIHLSLMCPTLIGIMETPYQSSKDSFTPIKLPHLRSLLIYCSEEDYSAGICQPASTRENLPSITAYNPHPWPTMTGALQRFVDTPDCCPTSTMVRMHTACSEEMEDLGIYNTMVVCDINSHTTRAIPIVKVRSTRQGGWLVRFDDSKGIITTTRGLIDVAEGQLWKTLVGGARLPSTIADSETQEILEVPIVAEDDWRAENTEINCELWNNEALVGKKVLHAEIRKEGVLYTNPCPVMEELPQGWYRPTGGRRRGLVRDEGV